MGGGILMSADWVTIMILKKREVVASFPPEVRLPDQLTLNGIYRIVKIL